jgi:hypothetical protein
MPSESLFSFILSLIDSFDDILTTDGVNDWIELVDQLRLLMTVAMYHPTFRIEQRLRIYEARIHLDKILHSRQSQSINNTPISSGNNVYIPKFAYINCNILVLINIYTFCFVD